MTPYMMWKNVENWKAVLAHHTVPSVTDLAVPPHPTEHGKWKRCG
jgi:hypothetical protein